MTSIGTTTNLPGAAVLATSGIATGSAGTAATAPTTTAASTQATQGAAQVQAAPQAEAFNAPPLDLPANPTTRDVLDGLVGAMADPSINASTAQRLYELHEQILRVEQSMSQAILDLMASS